MDSLLTLLLPTSCLYNLVLWCHSLIIQNNWVITIRSVNENLPAITKNVTTINSLQFPPEWALRGLRMETNGLPAAKPSARAPAPTGIPWGIQNEKERDLSPRQLRPRSKQRFQGAQTLASSQTSKVNECPFFLKTEDVSFKQVKWNVQFICLVSVTWIYVDLFSSVLFWELCWSAWSQSLHTADSNAGILRHSTGQEGEVE